ncbi:MAG TPA: TonB-dependent receptor [Lutibacter sp.]|nr:TonB-dependent receptor [Lutibacter sp.]
MQKKTIPFFLLAISSLYTFAQSITLQGTVKDKQGQILEMANVIALNKETGGMASFSTTDEKGFYKIKLSAGKSYIIRVSYLGFATKKLNLQPDGENKKLLQNFTLTEKENQLEGVELTYEMPVTIKGDTIIYMTDAFTTGKEKKLGDVLEKLPGIEINEEGEVEVEGKKISKIMVEGKDFFDGDSKLAIKNIPANAIKKVEVLKNYSEVSQMSGLENDEDAIALNIKLKEGKDHFWFGEITAGGGADERYLVHPKLFYYSPKKSLNILTDLNNIGEVPFTMRDYFKFSGGFKNIMKKGHSAMRISSEQVGFSLLKNDKAKAIDTKFGALNFNYTISDKLDFSGFAIYNETDTEMLTQRNEYYVATDISDFKTVGAAQKNQLGMFKLSGNYKPNTAFQLDYDAIVKKSQQSEITHTNSTISDLIDTEQQQEPFSVNQNLNAYYTLNDNHIFSAAVQHLYDENTPIYTASSAHEFFIGSDILALEANERYDLTQNKQQSTQKVDAKLDYFYVLNNTSNLNFTLGNTYTSQTLDTHISQELMDQTTNIFTDRKLQNQSSFAYNDLFLAMHYNLKFGKLTLTPGVSVHHFTINDTQFGDDKKHNLQRLLPDLFIKYKFKNTRSLRFEYGIATNFSDINKYTQGYILSNYQTLIAGNRAIESELAHSYTLRYRDFNMYNFTSIYATISYQKRVNAVKTQSNPMSVDRISEYINMLTPDESISGRLRYSKRFGKFKAVASTNLSYAESYSLNRNKETKATNFTQNHKLGLSTRFKNAPNFEIGYKLNISDYASNTKQNQYITNKPYANIEVPFLKDFIFTADYSYQNYRNKDTNTADEYSFLSSKLYYQKKGSQWEFIVSGTNLLQTTSLDTNSASDFLISSSSYFVQPNYYMLTLKYNL